MEFDKHESARWTQATGQVAAEYLEARDKVLADDAARGFPTVTGEGLLQLLAVGFKAKKMLTEANGKIYEEERGRLFQVVEFNLKLGVQTAKLAMLLFREQILNQVSLEQTEEEALKEIQRADVERLNAETEKRQAAIINAKAAAEHEVNGYRLQVVEAEKVSLNAESVYINAQLATAEARLDIIDSIYEVLAAEQLVLAAEQRRADALQDMNEVLARIATIKEGMIPDYLAKAAAEEKLAQAEAQDGKARQALEELGFERNLLKRTEQDLEHQLKGQELNYALLEESLTRATLAVEFARTQTHRLLREHSICNEALIELGVLATSNGPYNFGIDVFKNPLFNGPNPYLSKSEIKTIDLLAELDTQEFKLTNKLKRSGDKKSEIEKLITKEVSDQIANIQSITLSKEGEVSASGRQSIGSTELTEQRIIISKD